MHLEVDNAWRLPTIGPSSCRTERRSRKMTPRGEAQMKSYHTVLAIHVQGSITTKHKHCFRTLLLVAQGEMAPTTQGYPWSLVIGQRSFDRGQYIDDSRRGGVKIPQTHKGPKSWPCCKRI